MPRLAAAALALALLLPSPARAQSPSTPPDLSGLWAAQVRFSPVAGPLLLLKNGLEWTADIAGFRVPARMDGPAISFELPDGLGRFRGRRQGADITGQWIAAPTQSSGMPFATPVVLAARGNETWAGEVHPLDDTFTWFLPLTRQPDGSYSTYLRNPERNQGRFFPAKRLGVEGPVIRLTGGRRDTTTRVLAEGRIEEDALQLPLNGMSLDFRRVGDTTASPFYPRGRPPAAYHYIPPVSLADGWPVGTVEDVGISRAGIEHLVRMLIGMSMDSLATLQIHSVLIARHGRLVVEEYFHGFDRARPHDTRSAAKSWTSVLLGAAMQDGVQIQLNTPVYATLQGTQPPDPDPRKRAMTLEHLVSMTAGYDCGPDESVGNEDVMQEQSEEPDWYRYMLKVPLVTAPGDTLVYCSGEANLAAGMLRKISGEPLPEMFARLVGRPLQMEDYHLFLTPTGEAYGGGGHQFRPRDFLKLAQLMMNGGKWNGRQIVQRDWARQSVLPLRPLFPGQDWGWLWNSVAYTWQGRSIRAFFAGGNGGQIFMAIPDLDLAIGFTAGNYGQAATFIPGRVLVPEYILPAVE